MKRFFRILFYGYNGLMLWWLLAYWSDVGGSLHTGSHAEQTGAAVGATIGTSVIMFVWAAGSIITGLLVLLTRGAAQVQSTSAPTAQPLAQHEAPPREPIGTRSFGAATNRRAAYRPESFGQPAAAIDRRPAQSWSEIAFWVALIVCGLVFLGALEKMVGSDGTRTRPEAQEPTQSQATAPPQAAPAKAPATTSPGFSNFLSVDNIRLDSLPNDTLAVVTVRITSDVHRVKCAIRDGSRYIGVGYGWDASPPAQDVWVTLPGKGYGSGLSLNAECSE